MFLEQVEAVVSLWAVQVRTACSSVVSVVRLAPFDGYITTTTAAAPAPALQLLLGCSSQKILDQKRYFCLIYYEPVLRKTEDTNSYLGTPPLPSVRNI